ncbi:hypothetical protein [Sphingopyxis terrae]|uniref:hypothetical protein n=1 Tax=Sphingopyxis terrae TaxID=33052 RepID=UPI001C2C64BB|nr:hypothetical protein [Sphingopyxis terrae]QXF11275.1 hypothetical protein HBA51_03180 [Sphingopyxis terrae subsp. terrae]
MTSNKENNELVADVDQRRDEVVRRMLKGNARPLVERAHLGGEDFAAVLALVEARAGRLALQQS